VRGCHTQGTVEQIGSDKYKVTGIITKLDDTTLEITELPIGMWTQTYKELLEAMMEGTAASSADKDKDKDKDGEKEKEKPKAPFIKAGWTGAAAVAVADGR
jgi:hypothetical protein